MLNDEICNLRDKLNKSIEQDENYDVIYQLSIDLDELIAQYYERTVCDRDWLGQAQKDTFVYYLGQGLFGTGMTLYCSIILNFYI